MILWASIAAVITLLACRFMPGPKCVTYCKFRQIKFKLAKEKLREMSVFQHLTTGDSAKFKSISFGNLNYDQLCRLYMNSRPYGCSELIQEEWFVAARNALQEAIAEKQLLE